jgi:hypothetical protein
MPICAYLKVFVVMGIDFEEKDFYDILKSLCIKYALRLLL